MQNDCKTVDTELSLKRDGDKFCVIGRDRLNDGTLGVIIQDLGKFNDPVDALIQFQFLNDPAFQIQASEWTEKDREEAKAKLRTTLMTSDRPKIVSIRDKLGLTK